VRPQDVQVVAVVEGVPKHSVCPASRAALRGVARSFDPDVLIDEWVADMQERVDAGELSANTLST